MRVQDTGDEQKSSARGLLETEVWVKEVENTMKEMLEFVDKLQEDLDEGNTSKLVLEN